MKFSSAFAVKVGLAIIVLCDRGFALESPIDHILSAEAAQRPMLIAHTVESQYSSLRQRTIRVRIERQLYLMGYFLKAENRREPDIELIDTPMLVCSSQFGRAEGIVKRAGTRLVNTFDGSRSYRYRIPATGREAYQVDVYCSKPSFAGGSFGMFLQATGTGDVFNLPGFYELWSELDFAGVQSHPDYGRVAVLNESTELPSGERFVRHYFGEIDGELAYRGNDKIISPKLGVQQYGRPSTHNYSYSIDYERMEGILLPSSWTYWETMVSVDDANRPVGRPRLRERSISKVVQLDFLDQFPLIELDVPLEEEAIIVDRCGPRERIVADLSQVGTTTPRNKGRYRLLGVLVVIGGIVGYVIWRRRAM